MRTQAETPEVQLRTSIDAFLLRFDTTAMRTAALVSALESPAGPLLRRRLAEWVVRLAPVETLVPEFYRRWRPVVRDAMAFVVTQLSSARLAPKIVEQLELPAETTAEARLLRLISRVPGLQKIGQLLARNRRLDPPLRLALSELENDISDVSVSEIQNLLREQLGERIRQFRIRIDPEIFSEASVSAVLRFTWFNPDTRRREVGVFKVMKPYVPSCYSEDMKILQRLAAHLARRKRYGGIRLSGVAETLREIRLLMEHEVDFRREQETIGTALRIYRSTPGVCIPRVIEPLCTPIITALTREVGVKITDALDDAPRQPRVRVAERLAQALMAVPALALERSAIFHADPHAGNILYNKRKRELIILDWALTERLTSQDRRNVLMLVLMAILRDEDGICRSIGNILFSRETDPARSLIVRERVKAFLGGLPLFRIPGAMDAMRLLEEIGLEGLRFPAALLMFRKASFTLEGVLQDVAGAAVQIDSVLARYALTHWIAAGATLLSLLSLVDWITLECSALTFPARMIFRAMLHPQLWTECAGQAAEA